MKAHNRILEQERPELQEEPHTYIYIYMRTELEELQEELQDEPYIYIYICGDRFSGAIGAKRAEELSDSYWRAMTKQEERCL